MSSAFDRTKRWFVYAFKGDMLFTAYADHMNDGHVASLKMNGWKIFRRRAK